VQDESEVWLRVFCFPQENSDRAGPELCAATYGGFLGSTTHIFDLLQRRL